MHTSRPLFVLAASTAIFAVLPQTASVVFAQTPSVVAQPVSASLESRIVAATVYPDRAVVTRSGRALVPLGITEWVLSGLPASLDDDSVQISARGGAASLLDVAVRTVFTEEEPDARVQALEQELDGLRREDGTLVDRAARNDARRSLLGSIEKAWTTPVASTPGTTPPERPGLKDYVALLDFSSAQRQAIDHEQRELERERTALAAKIAAAEARLAELRGEAQGRRATKTVTVRIAAESAGERVISLAYALPGASWAPAYDARLAGADKRVTLDSFGVVRNATGEDWRDVELVLSTARPSLGGAAPEPSPWFVDVAKPMALGSLSRARRSFDAALAMPASASDFAVPETEMQEAAKAVARVEGAETSASFRIGTTVSLPSDNTTRRLPLGSLILECRPQYVATPKLTESAYLVAEVANTGEAPLLGGPLHVFLGDTFVAASQLATTMPGARFQLQLGADEGIAVKRRVVSRFTEDTGLATKSRRTSYEIVTTVTNHKRTTERVVVQEAIPVARDEKILVKLAAPSERDLLSDADALILPPKAGVVRSADGRLSWRIDLKPGEKRDLLLRFSIEHPADLPVTGVE